MNAFTDPKADSELSGPSAESASSPPPCCPFLPPLRNWAGVWKWAVLALAPMLAYWPALGGGYLWDDDLAAGNPMLYRADGLWEIWTRLRGISAHDIRYMPLLYTTFWLEGRLWGDHALAHHLVNVLIHIASGLILWRILRRLKIPGAWAAAMLFALHPAGAESVVWVIERKGLLGAFFALLAARAWIEYLEEAPRPQRTWLRPKCIWWWLSFALFLASLLSKPTALLLPAGLFALAWWRRGLRFGPPENNAESDAEKEQRKPSFRRAILELAPFFALAAAAAFFSALMARGLDPFHSGFSLPERIQFSARNFAIYIRIALWPTNLQAVYPPWLPDVHLVSAWAPAFISTLAVTACGGALWTWQNRAGAAPLLALVFFAVPLVPILGLMDFGYMGISPIANRYVYLSIAPVCALIAGGAVRAADRAIHARHFVFLRALAAALFLLLGALTWRQAALYADAATLYSATVRANPLAWAAWNNLGTELLRLGRTDEAARAFEKTLGIHPRYPNALVGLANVDIQKGNTEAAIERLRAAIEIEPQYADAHYNLGLALAMRGDSRAAREALAESLRLMPESAEARYNLGTLELMDGEYARSVESFRAAIALNPNHAKAHANLAFALARLRRFDEAIESASRALRLAREQNNSALAAAMERFLASSVPVSSTSASSAKGPGS